jgi:hypothetical protein
MKDFLEDGIRIVGGILTVLFLMSIVLMQFSQETPAADAAAAGVAAGNAVANMLEVAFVPCLMIGALILVARYMGRKRSKAKPN